MGQRIMMYFTALLVIITITFVCVFFVHSEEDTENIRFLERYGWEVKGGSVETADIIIPDPFDLVYENYNALQKRAGLDLSPYMGKRGKRYTYIIGNYPREAGDEVRANVICVDGKAVGGDIMTVSANGFMHSLRFEDAFGGN